jgi:uncharacterized MAPEG superfamily protein
MDIVHAVIALALLQFLIFGGFVGRARVTTGIEAPAMTGDPVFERTHRVHYNTMEQLVMFIPGMLLFGAYINTVAATLLGLLFIIGRIIYYRAYLDEPAKRSLGFGLTIMPTSILLLGGLVGAVWSAVKNGV